MSNYIELALAVLMLIAYILFFRKDKSPHFKICISWLILNIVYVISVISMKLGLKYVNSAQAYDFTVLMSCTITVLRYFRMFMLFVVIVSHFIQQNRLNNTKKSKETN